WSHDGQDLSGKTSANLDLGNITSAQAGRYSVVVRDSTGASITSDAANVVVLEPIPGLFNTGVDAAGNALEDGSVDPHYLLILNPEDNTSTNALVEDSTGFPIVAGPWIANTETSKWIGPVFTSTAAGGDYTYRTTFTIPTDFDVSTVRVQGVWTSDNNGADIIVNGASSGVSNTGDFANLVSFLLTTGWKAGQNTIDFQVSNAGTDANPTGLRVQGIRADGVKGAGGGSPRVTISTAGSQVRITWPVAATGYKLKTTPSLTSPQWSDVSPDPIIDGDEYVATFPPAGMAGFYQLQK